ncbi:hypothetical protein ACOMHN_041204 [Nucella lapillus]
MFLFYLSLTNHSSVSLCGCKQEHPGRSTLCLCIKLTSLTNKENHCWHSMQSQVLTAPASLLALGRNLHGMFSSTIPIFSKDFPDEEVLMDAESFVCKLYNPNTQHTSTQPLRCDLFHSVKKTLKNSPPTQDALNLHIKRSTYQALVWRRAGN